MAEDRPPALRWFLIERDLRAHLGSYLDGGAGVTLCGMISKGCRTVAPEMVAVEECPSCGERAPEPQP